MKLVDLMFLFCVVVALVIGDFISLRILIPKMVSSENDILVIGGFIWLIILVFIHGFLALWYFNRDKFKKDV